MKLFFVLLLVAGLSATAWVLRDSDFVRRLIRPDAVDSGRADKNGREPPTDGGSARLNRPESMGVHKCKQGTEVIYINGACPQGSKQQSITAGTVTVMPVEDDAGLRQRQSEKTVGK